MNRAQDFDLAAAAHAALAGKKPPRGWDHRLHAAIAESLGDLHYREGRFLMALGTVVAVLSLAVDALIASDHFTKIAAVRLAAVLPFTLSALLLPRRLLALQKLLMGLSLIGFGVSMAYASAFVPSPDNALLALGVVTLFGLALPVLPFRRWQMIGFALLYGLAVGGFLLLHGAIVDYAKTFIPIMMLTMGAATVLAHRIHWIERRNLLLTLQADERTKALEESNARLTELSMKDPLTGLANRRRAEDTFAEHYATPVTVGQAGTALFMVDLDHFKAFNDHWGHQAGDACLRAVAEVMRHSASRHGGLAARFGGEEFVVFLRADDATQAHAIAEELRVAIERIEIDHPASATTVSCTTSIGIALHKGPNVPELADMLARADAALYRAKAEGRNRSLMAA